MKKEETKATKKLNPEQLAAFLSMTPAQKERFTSEECQSLPEELREAFVSMTAEQTQLYNSAESQQERQSILKFVKKQKLLAKFKGDQAIIDNLDQGAWLLQIFRDIHKIPVSG